MYNMDTEFENLIGSIHNLQCKYNNGQTELEQRLSYLESELDKTKTKQNIVKKHLNNMLQELGEI